MIARHLASKLTAAARKYPVVTVTGPRQSGKTTLVRSVFPKARYVSLEAPDQRTFAAEDPRGFLRQFSGRVILDEIQRVPELFSYIQVLADEAPRPGRFILAGSQNFLLLQNISQTLAGRSAILHLLPFSLAELNGHPPVAPASLGQLHPRRKPAAGELLSVLHTGFYPRIHDQKLDPAQWLAGYVQTYVERDVRNILNVGDVDAFDRFVRLCAGRNGQLLNLSSLGADCGISHTTARRWISLLEASFIAYPLRPHHQNFSKRLIKSPKLYFLDTGLLCYLLRIRTPEDLANHASRGAIFESLVVSEMVKSYLHRGLEADIYFWRDSTGHEVDVLIDSGKRLLPIEIKSGQTVASDSAAGLDYWRALAGDPAGPAALVYGGDPSYIRRDVAFHSWRDL
jgi:predicted AAA+ superfamily ATPase